MVVRVFEREMGGLERDRNRRRERFRGIERDIYLGLGV